MKIKFVASVLVAIVIVVFSIGYIFKINVCPVNREILIETKDISISLISSRDLESFSLVNSFYDCRLTENEINAMKEQPDRYRKITILYKFKNNSSSIKISDVRFYPQLFSELDKYIYKYNTGNGTYFVFCDPDSSGNITQEIIIKDCEIKDDELYDMLNQSRAKMTYFTGNSGWSDGHKLVGTGKHEILFNIGNGEIISNK